MATLEQILKQASRRRAASRAIRAAGTGALIAAAAGFAVLMLDRLGIVAAPWPTYPILCAFGLLIGGATAMLRRENAMREATTLDATLHLRDRLGSAVAIQQGLLPAADQQHAFAQLTVHDAERIASTVSVRRAVPVRFTAVWNATLVACAVLTVAVLFMPPMRRSSAAEQRDRDQQVAARVEQERNDVRQTIQSTVQDLQTDGVEDPAVTEQLDALRELDQQLSREAAPRDVSGARDEAAARLNDIAERLEEQAQRDQRAVEELSRRFEQFEPAEAPPTTRELIEQLRSGDLNRVADELERLLDESAQLDETQRQEAAQSLRSASDALGESSTDDAPNTADTLEQLEQVMRDRGLDDDAVDELANPQGPRTERELTDELMSRGVDEPTARQLAEQLHEAQQQRKAQQQAEQDQQAVRDALEQAADQLDPSSQQPPTDAEDIERQASTADEREAQRSSTPPQQSQRESATNESPQSSEPSPSPQRDSSPQPPADDSTSDARQSSSSSSQQTESSPPRESQAGDDTDSSSQPTQQADGTRQVERQSESTAGETQRESVPTPQDTQQPAQRESSPSPTPQQTEPQPQPQPGETNAESPSAQAQGARETTQPMPQPSSPEAEPPASPAEIIRELQRRRDAVERLRNLSDQARQRARDMAEQMPEEQQQRWAREFQRQLGDEATRDLMREMNEDERTRSGGAAPGRAPGEAINAPPSDTYSTDKTEPVDVRGDEQQADQLLSEWLSDQPLPDGAPSAGRADAPSSAVRRAQDFARRAVNETTVPRRYHRMIDRYFGRLPQTIEDAATGARDTNPDAANTSDRSER